MIDKVLFLDIDGVLNGHEKHLYNNYCKLKESCFINLNKIIKETRCKIIISSAWRYIILDGEMTLRGFKYMLFTHGLCHDAEIIGCTKRDDDIFLRDDQILDYVKEHGIKNYIVLDDNPMDMDASKLNNRLIKTDEKVGLTEIEVEKAIKLLN